MQNKSSVPAISNLSFREPENVKQNLPRKIEYYDFNVVDYSETRRVVGRQRDKHQQRPEFDEGAEATSVGKWRIPTWSGGRGAAAIVSIGLSRKLTYQHYWLKRFRTLLLRVQSLIYSRWDKIPPTHDEFPISIWTVSYYIYWILGVEGATQLRHYCW